MVVKKKPLGALPKGLTFVAAILSYAVQQLYLAAPVSQIVQQQFDIIK